MEIKFEMEKETKNTIRFKEVVGGPLDTPNIGTIYIPKATLKQAGYEPGTQLIVELKAK